ncbi:type II toxin-antitoxin system RelB family antitoxin [Companilactobacillus mindensis]|uniref:type II toxin-antitoxin system RelB family antitoxin n=1 Tax=Companilactobacillus mindensis TaxID=167481 RepID=UPI00070D8763|nr:DUF6290 family protein [Companilactobacillus mindensis]GEO78423.1 hypothetical protein LMI01_07540 [Companilactobacillus mindensis]
MTTISIYVSDHDEKLIRNYAKSKHMSVSSFLHSAVMDRIEDEIDDRLCEKAEREFKCNPQDVSLDEMRKELNNYCY